MIRVVRPPEPAPVHDALNKLGRRDKKTELEKARQFYQQKRRPKKAFHFERYKEWEVCRALDELFHEKCAYCESIYRAVDARDIEHYRPKAGVTESPDHWGYWWLAADWHNLLPSCPPCNQRRRHVVFDPGMTLEAFELALLREPQQRAGKANAFPTRNNNWVMTETDWVKMKVGGLTAEDPLLINPCERNPADHVEFLFEWDRKDYFWEADKVIVLVKPKWIAGEEDPYAKASIAVYGLNRAGLIRERAAWARILQKLCQPIVDCTIDLGNSPDPAEEIRLMGRVDNYWENLRTFTEPKQPYAAMAHAFIQQFEEELKRIAVP